MRKFFLSQILILLIIGFAFASPEPELIPPDTYVSLPPSIEPDFPPMPEQEILQPDMPTGKPLTLQEKCNALQSLSSAPYYTFLRDLGCLSSNANQAPFVESNLAAEALPLTMTVSGPYNTTSDSQQDAEPAVMAYNNSGTIYMTTAYIKIVNGTTPRNYYSTTADFNTFYRGQLPMPTGYQYSFDPLMSKNPYSNGVAPGRIYASGIVANGSAVPPNAVSVWRTDNGGISWSQPTLAAVNNNPAYVLDKPAVAVSWYSGTRGHVYVAYIRIDATHNPPNLQNGLFIAKSTDGGLTFVNITPNPIVTGYIQGPQILVNSNNGYIYVLWTDFNLNAIRMSTSTNFGQNWSSPETAATGNMLSFPSEDHINGNVKAGSLPMARFNWAANKICVVWHEYQLPRTSPPKTDVYYTAKGPSGWQAKVRLNDVTTNDQFMPGIDFDTTGNLVVTFYDRRDDPNNLLYHLYMAHINSSGTRLEPTARVSTFQTDPTRYTGTYRSFIGDYQDLWYQTGFPSGAWYLSGSVGIAWNSIYNAWWGDIYGYGIQP